MISSYQAYGMNMQRVMLTLVGAIVSLILAMILVWYSKKTITKTMSRRHILHMLKTRSMSGTELTNAAKGGNSPVISPRLVPVMLVKLQEESLIQRANNNRYVITTKGLELLKSLDSMSKEFQKVAKIVQKTSMVSKFMVNEAVDRVAMISGMDSSYGKEIETNIPVYRAEEQ